MRVVARRPRAVVAPQRAATCARSSTRLADRLGDNSRARPSRCRTSSALDEGEAQVHRGRASVCVAACRREPRPDDGHDCGIDARAQWRSSGDAAGDPTSRRRRGRHRPAPTGSRTWRSARFSAPLPKPSDLSRRAVGRRPSAFGPARRAASASGVTRTVRDATVEHHARWSCRGAEMMRARTCAREVPPVEGVGACAYMRQAGMGPRAAISAFIASTPFTVPCSCTLITMLSLAGRKRQVPNRSAAAAHVRSAHSRDLRRARRLYCRRPGRASTSLVRDAARPSACVGALAIRTAA